MSKTNYNYMAASGKMPVDDIDVCRDLGISEKYAYTKDINKAALNKALQRAEADMLEMEMPREAIDNHLKAINSDVREQIKKAEKISGRKLM